MEMNQNTGVPDDTDELDIQDTQSNTGLQGEVDQHNLYRSALSIFDDEQNREGSVRYTRRMKRKRIQDIMRDLIDPG